MLQPDASLPLVPLHPAPWRLRGSGWIVAMKLTPGSPATDAFVPSELAGKGRSPVSALMFVDYEESGCGAYRELLFLPGAFAFPDGRRHASISRIVVSTWDSVVNGRDNWGIPKDRADFEVSSPGPDGRAQEIRVLDAGREMCRLECSTVGWLPPLPVHSGLLPRGPRTLAQSFRGRTYYYAPEARGWIRPARLKSWRFDAGLWPDLAGASVLATVRVESFRMTFPVARVE